MQTWSVQDAQPSLKQLLLSDMGRTTDLQLPARGQSRRRSAKLDFWS
jgi:hypothetical protein